MPSFSKITCCSWQIHWGMAWIKSGVVEVEGVVHVMKSIREGGTVTRELSTRQTLYVDTAVDQGVEETEGTGMEETDP
eukprot:4516177-Ditylum_brightwellii.AAC.1